MSTEKLHFLKSTNIWIHRAHILHNNYLFCNRVHESHAWTQRYKDAGSLKYNFWYRSTNASVSSFAIQCQAQNGGMDKLLRRLYPLHSCKKIPARARMSSLSFSTPAKHQALLWPCTSLLHDTKGTTSNNLLLSRRSYEQALPTLNLNEQEASISFTSETSDSERAGNNYFS